MTTCTQEREKYWLLLSTLQQSYQKASGCQTSPQLTYFLPKAAKEDMMMFSNIQGAQWISRQLTKPPLLRNIIAK